MRGYSRCAKINSPLGVDCRSNHPFLNEESAQPAQAPWRLVYIDGTTPFAATTTKHAARAPSALGSVGMKSGARAGASVRLAGGKVTVGVPPKIVIFFS
jgi:hypothetical protein